MKTNKNNNHHLIKKNVWYRAKAAAEENPLL